MKNSKKIKLMEFAFANGQQTKERLANFVKSTDYFSMGEHCFEFERRFSAWQGVKHAVLVNSGSSANLILIQSLINLGKLAPGDAVMLSSVTWATNVMPIIQLGLVPVFCDVDLHTFNVSTTEFVQKLKSQNVKAFFTTNVLGLAGNLDEISKICAENSIIFLEDNCEGMGSELVAGKAGSFGLGSTFSLFVGHHISAIEGGIVCTNDEDLYEMLLMVRAHGWDRNLPASKAKELRKEHAVEEFFGRYCFYELGYNVRPTEITGFLATEELASLDDIIDIRSNNHTFYLECLDGVSGVVKQHAFGPGKSSAFALPIILEVASDRNILVEKAKEEEIECRPLIAGNMTKQPFYKKYNRQWNKQRLENANVIDSNGLYFPNHHDITKGDIERIVALIQSVSESNA